MQYALYHNTLRFCTLIINVNCNITQPYYRMLVYAHEQGHSLEFQKGYQAGVQPVHLYFIIVLTM